MARKKTDYDPATFDPSTYKEARTGGARVTFSDGNTNLKVSKADEGYLASLGWEKVGELPGKDADSDSDDKADEDEPKKTRRAPSTPASD